MGSFQEVLLILIFSFADLKLMSASYSWNVFSLQVGDIWKCHEVKHIMIMIITIIYTFLFYIISSWKLLSENPQASWKNPLPFFYSQLAFKTFWDTTKNVWKKIVIFYFIYCKMLGIGSWFHGLFIFKNEIFFYKCAF